MPNTTNYNWDIPADTDLVKDGAAAMRTLGNSIDTTTKNLNPETTLGDIAYRSATANTNTRLPIGTTGQVLTVAGGVPTWAAPAGDITAVTAGTGLSGGGTSGDVTLTNTVATAFDAKGDLVVGTGADTFAKLTVGTNGHTLVADSSTTTGLKWAAPSSGALALISRTTFSNVATQDFDSVFTSTYSSYTIILEQMGAATAADDLQIQFRAAGSTLASGYYGNAIECNFGGSTVTNNATSNGSALMITTYAGPSSENSAGFIEFTNVGDAALRPVINWHYYAMSDGRSAVGGGQGTTTGTTYTGFRLKSSSSNISGTVAIYGRVKA